MNQPSSERRPCYTMLCLAMLCFALHIDANTIKECGVMRVQMPILFLVSSCPKYHSDSLIPCNPIPILISVYMPIHSMNITKHTLINLATPIFASPYMSTGPASTPLVWCESNREMSVPRLGKATGSCGASSRQSFTTLRRQVTRMTELTSQNRQQNPPTSHSQCSQTLSCITTFQYPRLRGFYPSKCPHWLYLLVPRQEPCPYQPKRRCPCRSRG